MVYLLKPIEIDGLASLNMVIFHGYVTNNQRVGYSKSDFFGNDEPLDLVTTKNAETAPKTNLLVSPNVTEKYPINGDFHGKIMCTVNGGCSWISLPRLITKVQKLRLEHQTKNRQHLPAILLWPLDANPLPCAPFRRVSSSKFRA